MGKVIFYFMFHALLFQLNVVKAQVTSLWNEDSSLYFFTINDAYLNAEKLDLNESLTTEEILDSITSLLSTKYFVDKGKYYIDKTKISINLDSLIVISTDSDVYRIAIVNIVDPDKVCMTTFFQGSTGGNNTFLVLAANLFQSQMEDPLVEGIIFLYNKKELKGMDHINLEGLVSERDIDHMIWKAIKK